MVGVQPYTTIKDESHIKALTYVPRNKDHNGSAFNGVTFLKQISLENANNKTLKYGLITALLNQIIQTKLI